MSIRFGIIGTGVISTRFGGVVAKTDGVTLHAVADTNEAMAAKFAETYGVPQVYHNIDALLQDKDVDVVYIGAPTSFHTFMAKRAILCGKAVISEKPMSMTAADAESLKALAEANDCFLMEGMWTLCMPAVLQAKKWIEAGRIGRVRQIYSEFSFRAPYTPAQRLFNPALGGGSLFDVGVYCIFLSNFIMGSAPTTVCGVADIAPTGVDVNAAFTLKYPTGGIASGVCGFQARSNTNAWIYGSDGSIWLDDFYRCQCAELRDQDGNVVERFEESCEDGFAYEIKHVRDLLLAGKTQSPLIPLQASVDCAKVYDQLLTQWGISAAPVM
ncbi:Gfo/Idh/MocA family oxidoreductase [Eubacteriales bacterium OttesenSCG-928-N13]|nr:Gfo/Idh/MocA family oxidoreductase [Eubacteriales bacterium OttesenSCG-928-N13]